MKKLLLLLAVVTLFASCGDVYEYRKVLYVKKQTLKSNGVSNAKYRYVIGNRSGDIVVYSNNEYKVGKPIYFYQQMNVTLDRRDICSLLRGTDPFFSVMNDPIVIALGNWTGGFNERWNWNSLSSIEASKYSDEQLFKTYELCKKSWR